MAEKSSISQLSDVDEEDEELVSFETMGLDVKLLSAINDIGWKKPTLIQEKAIPLALEGHDILARARTGTGKTSAFAIPILHKMLDGKKYSTNNENRALILAPSKELCNQIFNNFTELTKYCKRMVSIMDLSQGNVKDKCDLMITEKPNVLISTPRKIIEYLSMKIMHDIKSQIKYLAIDESDLMFSFGYQDDLMKVINLLPNSGIQHYLMSATLNTDVKELKTLIMNNPVILKLEEPDLPESDRLHQYHIEVFDDEEKFVLINALLKLGLIVGKSIIFVNNVDRCYQLKLFLEQFGISTCVLNSELPIVSRCHVVEKFNSGVYDIIIASDEKCVTDPEERSTKKSKARHKSSMESGVSRGIDFKFVSNVINFDFPTTVDSYVHRVGRTARGNEEAEGNILSLVSPVEMKYFKKVTAKYDQNGNFKPYLFKMDELEAFRYRARDALRAVTSVCIHDARLKEIKREMLASKNLNGFFRQHPKDHKILKFDRPLHVVKSGAHLADVPEYIVPKTLQTVVRSKREAKRIETAASFSYEPKRKKKRNHISNNNKMKRKNSGDPLKTFQMNAIRKYKEKKRAKKRRK